MKTVVRRCSPLWAALVLATCASTATAGATEAAAGALDAGAPLTTDPSVLHGELPNGVRYWIEQRPEAAGRAAVWMRIAAGSLHDGDGEEGLAHLVEHMAFRGTRNYPHGALTQRLEAMGLAIGTDENAATTLRGTTYKLTLPKAGPATLAEAIRIMADFAYRRDPSLADLARERRVVLAEMLESDSYDKRVDGKVFAAALAGARAGDRLPLGSARVVENAGLREVDRFLARWYRPERTTLVVVGDVAPAAVIASIEGEFGPFRARTPPPVEPPALGEAWLRSTRLAHRAVVVTDPEQPFAEIRLVHTEPAQPSRTIGDFRRVLAERLAVSVLNGRLRDAEDAGAPFDDAYAAVEPSVDGAAEQAVVYGFAPAGSWRALLGALVTAVERTSQTGFSAGELDRARGSVLAELRARAAGADTRPARALAADLTRDLATGQPLLAPSERLALAEALAPDIQPGEAADALRARFSTAGRLLAVILPARAGLAAPGRAEVARVAARAAREAAGGPGATDGWAAAMERPQRPLDGLLEEEPVPGEIAEQSSDGPSEVTSLTLANGVRVHIRSMSDRKDKVRVQLTLAGGELLETPTTRGLSEAAALAFDTPATASLSPAAIRSHLAGRDLDLSGCSCDGDGISAELVAGRPDLEKGMRLLHLVLTRGRITAPALQAWKDRDREWAAREASDPELRLDAELAAAAAGGDTRARALTVDQIARVDLAAAQAWFDRHRTSAPLEVAMVGDAPREELVRLACKYLGSLPARPPLDTLAALRQPQPRGAPAPWGIAVDGITPRAALALAWRGPELGARADRERLDLAAAVLTERLHQELRVRRGLTYGVRFQIAPALALRGTGTMTATLSTDPRRAREAMRVARQVVERFAATGPTPDELGAARRQLESRHAAEAHSPSAWADRLAALELRGEDVRAVAPPGPTDDGQTAPIEAEDVRATLARYLGASRPVALLAMPAWNLALGVRGAPSARVR